LVRSSQSAGTLHAIPRKERESFSDLDAEEHTMKNMGEKMARFAKQAVKLLAIELLVPGGTLVVLAILLARGSASGRWSRLVALVPIPWRHMRGTDSSEYALETS
jgi:hypothetical protein